MNTLAKLKAELAKVEKQLEKHRKTCGELHGNGTMRKAKASRNWDYYAQEKNRLRGAIDELEMAERDEMEALNYYCVACGAMFKEECVCDELQED